MPGQAIVTIRDKQWQTSIAATPWELTQGLGGLAELAPNTGMFFDTGYEQIIQVTTVPMLFPIDIVFFSESLAVTEIYSDIEPGFIVTPTSLARYFLEVNAGELEGIEVGDTAQVEVLSLAETPVSNADWTSMMVSMFGFMVMGVFMIAIVKNVVAGIGPEKKPVLYGPRGEKLLPHTKPAEYEIETDRMGNIIITCSGNPGQDVFLQFESDKALVYDLLRKGEKKDLDAGWSIRIKRTEPRASTLDELWKSSAQAQKSPQTRKQKVCRSDVSVDSWQERDRLGIWIIDRRTDKVIAEWWDDDARQMFEDGFFKPGKQLSESVLDYAESVGLLADGKYLGQTSNAYYWTAVNKGTGEIAENYTPYTSSSRALRGGKAFVSRQWQGLALVEVWKQPRRYSDGLKIEPVTTETVALGQSPAVIPTIGEHPHASDEPVARLLQKWSEAKARNSALALKDLEALSPDYDIAECKELLHDYRNIDRSDYNDQVEYQEARDEAWEGFLECLESLAGEEEAMVDSSGKPAVMPVQPQPQKGTELEYFPDSPEFLAYTIDDIGYREKIDSAFLSAIKRARGKE